MEELQKIAIDQMQDQHFDSLAVGVLDFESGNYNTFVCYRGEILEPGFPFYFDLASLTKVLTVGALYQKSPELFTEEMHLLLCHRAGLPVWGLLDKKTWQEQLMGFAIKESKTEYSDFSNLRLMLELENITKQNAHDLCNFYWDRELLHWHDLPEDAFCPETGFRQGRVIQGEVHDPNAFVLENFLTHAGLFGTIGGVVRSLLELDKQTGFVGKQQKAFKGFNKRERYLHGWDTVADPKETLAGEGCGEHTFGHLGFTGTSIWIDADKKRANIILTNATQNYWYDRHGLNRLRRVLGKAMWAQKII